MKWIKIGEDVFNVDGSVQFSIGSHANIYLSLDINLYPTYYKYFTKLYEKQQGLSSFKKFDIISSKFNALGSIIKSLDIEFNKKINIQIVCDLLIAKDIESRRDEIIDDLLNNETLIIKNNIKQ